MSLKRAAIGHVALGAALGFLAGCSAQKGTLSLNIIVSPNDDPFRDAASVRVTVGDSRHVKTFPVNQGHFTINYGLKPIGSAPVLVEAFDAAGNLVARGQTPPLPVVAQDNGPVGVWVGRPGRAALSPAVLPTPRAEMAATYVAGLGVVYAGGREANGAASDATALYYIFSQAILETGGLNSARAGAVLFPNGNFQAAVLGGSAANGPRDPSLPVSTPEVFDPSLGRVGRWTALPGNDALTRSQASLIAIGNSYFLSGGLDARGMPLQTAAQVFVGSTQVVPLAAMMQAARAGHAVATATFPDGGGAILFGGNAGGPVTERLVGPSFAAYELPGVATRSGASATTLASGDVLIVGGHDTTGPLDSGFVVHPVVPPGVMFYPRLLSTARDDHTATLVSGDLLVCGGIDRNGRTLASCDLLNTSTIALKSTVALSVPRHGHAATVLETGPVVLAGGLGDDGQPLASIDIYTP